jgi:hypothetical protein
MKYYIIETFNPDDRISEYNVCFVKSNDGDELIKKCIYINDKEYFNVVGKGSRVLAVFDRDPVFGRMKWISPEVYVDPKEVMQNMDIFPTGFLGRVVKANKGGRCPEAYLAPIAAHIGEKLKLKKNETKKLVLPD